ncbi:MAG: hypothetical protein MJ069_10775, partial [Salinivirgaceae bacterium]|nr:hypothetical protein [Salinivirgaceae bacterium]
LFLLAPIQTFAQADSIIVVDNTIRDTVKLSTNFATIYINEKGHYIAVDADGNEKDITANVGSKSRTLVQSSNGEQLVIDSKGQLMGVTEYKQTGGNKTLLAQRSAEKDSLMATTGNVTFTSIGDYLFDTYDSYKSHTASQNYAQRFLSIGAGNYRPAYACIESYAKVKLNADPYTNITFKTERGVPVICNNGELSITGFGDHDTLAIYAYKDTTLVGKVNVMCYDKVTRKICLVPIGKSNVPSAETLKKGLDAIFAKLMVDFDVTVSEAIEIDYTNGTNFTHGGSGVIGVYNTDQKAAITKLEELGTDNETVYLFMVEDAVTLNETDGYTVTSGYMPRGYQYGFIYKELTNARTIAHEIAHGAFHLEHTFAQSNYLAPEGTTDNLMDYNGGETLNHWQWQDVHDPKRVWLKWAQEESGAEMRTDNETIKVFITETEQTNYGLDFMDNTDDNYVSVECMNETKFHVSTHFPNVKLYFSMSNNVSNDFEMVVDSIGVHDGYDITIKSLTNYARSSMLQIHTDSINGNIVNKVRICSYNSVSTNLYIHGINQNLDNIDKDAIQKMFSQAVIRIGDFSVTRNELSFDINHNGFLDIYTEGDNPELLRILNNGNYSNNRNESIVVINTDIHRSYRLKRSISVGDTVIIIKHQDDKIRNKQINKLFIGDISTETLTIIDVKNDTLYLGTPVLREYSDTVLVWRNLAGISTAPQIIKHKSNDINKVIVHERLHRSPFGLLDLGGDAVNQDNIMLYYDSSGARKLRNRQLKIRKDDSYEKQWDKIVR